MTLCVGILSVSGGIDGGSETVSGTAEPGESQATGEQAPFLYYSTHIHTLTVTLGVLFMVVYVGSFLG